MLLLLIPLIVIPYTSRVLGSDAIGKYSFYHAFVTYFVILATLGTSSFGQRQVAYDRDNKEELTNTFWNIFTFRIITKIFFYCYN